MAIKTKTPNQLIGLNLGRARLMRGWTQEQAAVQIEPFLGQRWSKATFSAAERSWEHAHRIRQFTGDELVAFAAAFDLPIAWFFEPPTDRHEFTFASPGASKSLDYDELWRLERRDVDEAIGAMFQVRSREEEERARQRVAEQFGRDTPDGKDKQR